MERNGMASQKCTPTRGNVDVHSLREMNVVSRWIGRRDEMDADRPPDACVNMYVCMYDEVDMSWDGPYIVVLLMAPQEWMQNYVLLSIGRECLESSTADITLHAQQTTTTISNDNHHNNNYYYSSPSL